MQEKTEELYREYLENILDIIFDENNGLGKRYPNDIYFEALGEVYDNGYKIVRSKKGKNFIDKKGKLFGDIWYDDLYGFEDGCALVYYNGSYNFINKNGKLLSDEGYEYASSFSCGCALVKKHSKYMFIDTNGNPLNNELYDYAESFSCGYAKVEKNDKCNFIDTKGKLLTDICWYSYVSSFVDGIALVLLNGRHNIIDTNGKLLSDTGYDDVDIFKGGCAAIKENDKYYLVNTKGEQLGNIGFNKIFTFQNGVAIVQGNQGYNLINTKGKILSKIWFDEIKGHPKYLYVKIDNTYNFIDRQGELLSDIWYTCEKDHYSKINDSFYEISPDEKFEKHVSIKCFKKYLNGYQIRKTITGYQCISGSNVFKVKYEPIAIYGSRYVLCLNNKNVVLYDKKSNKYKNLGLIKEIEYNDHFIFDYTCEKIFFMYQDNMIDITEYYKEKLNKKQEISIVSGVNILSLNDFYFKNENEVRELLNKERENNNKKQQEQKNKEDQQILRKTKELDEVEREEVRIEQKETLESIKILLNKLAFLQEKTGNYERISVDNLFIKVGDHKEINPLYIELGMLRYADLKGETFENVKVSGIDFRGCNIILNPRRVYNKDLSNCNFEGLHIDTWMDFRDVDIRGARFSQDNSSKTMDGQNAYFKEAIYDENTTYNGISFVEIYGECKNKPKSK